MAALARPGFLHGRSARLAGCSFSHVTYRTCILPCIHRGLTGEPIVLWGREFSGLVHKKIPPLFASVYLIPLEGVDTWCIHRVLIQSIENPYHFV